MQYLLCLEVRSLAVCPVLLVFPAIDHCQSVLFWDLEEFPRFVLASTPLSEQLTLKQSVSFIVWHCQQVANCVSYFDLWGILVHSCESQVPTARTVLLLKVLFTVHVYQHCSLHWVYVSSVGRLLNCIYGDRSLRCVYIYQITASNFKLIFYIPAHFAWESEIFGCTRSDKL